ncbi:hypothetical protein B0H10DRAFT_2369143 [Mycena sp. CBHHK59/15]|nr:hypothetical protein B0H10DRAFT_2369143 [Mycena sp. CBHHK59/15]
MTQSTRGCAQNADGSLREPSEIQFYNDVDDEHPISGPASAASTSSSPVLAPISTRGSKPVGKVAGSRRSPRRSSRATRPSARVLDPNHAEMSTTRRHTTTASPSYTLIAGARATVVQHWLDGKESLRIELGGLHYHFPLWIVDLWHQMVHTVIPAVNTWKGALVWLDQPAFKPFVGTIRGLHRHLSRLPWFGTIPALGAASLVPKATLTTFLSRSWFSGDQIDVCLLMLQALWEQNPTQAATTKIIDTNLMYSIVLRFSDHTAGVVYDLDNSGSLSALGAVLREGRDFGGIGHVGGNHWVAAGTAQGQEALLYGNPARKMPDWELTSAIRWFCLQYIPTISLESAITLESSYQQLEIDWWQCGLLSLNTQNKTSSL